MKKIIIITLFALTNPYLQSADWISNNLPQRWRVEPRWRDQVKLIQEKTGTSVPIIFINTHQNYSIAGVCNIGVGSFRFAIMMIDQTKLSSRIPALQIQTLAHETVHVDENHAAIINNSLTIAEQLLFWAGITAIGEYITCNKSSSNKTWALGLSSILASCIIKYTSPQIPTRKEMEFAAEKGSFEKIKKLGDSATLKELAEYYKNNASDNDATHEAAQRLHQGNPTHEFTVMLNYPRYQQLGEWAKAAYEECLENSKQPTL